jgi:hypothetical protein
MLTLIIIIIMSRLLQAAKPTNYNSAGTILTRLFFGRLPPSRLMTMQLNVILMYFNITILLSFSLSLSSFLLGMHGRWNTVLEQEAGRLTT